MCIIEDFMKICIYINFTENMFLCEMISYFMLMTLSLEFYTYIILSYGVSNIP